MNFTTLQIVNDPFYLFEKGNNSRNLSGYHVYVCRAFWNWRSINPKLQMDYICSMTTLRCKLINNLLDNGVLPSTFDRRNDDPFALAAFSLFYFKKDIRLVVNY